MADDATLREAAGKVLVPLMRLTQVTVAASLAKDDPDGHLSALADETSDAVVAALVNLVKVARE